MSVAPTPVSSPTLKPSAHYIAGVSTTHIEDMGWVNSGIPLSAEARNFAEAPNWKYDMRRDAQQIVPGLWLGPFTVATNKSRLLELGVTHMLCVRDSMEAHIVRPRFPGDFTYETLDLREHQDERLMTRLTSSLDFIHSARMQGGTVFAHCLSGMSASPTIVIAYLMRSQGLTYEDAVAQVQRQRFCITPNNVGHTCAAWLRDAYQSRQALAKQLWEWESVCKAQMAMDMATRASVGSMRTPSLSRSKRALDDSANAPERNVRATTAVGYDYDDGESMIGTEA